MHHGPANAATAGTNFEAAFGFEPLAAELRSEHRVVAVDHIRSARDLSASRRYRIAKRLVDLSLCSVMLPLVLPVFLSVAAAVWISSPGPLFYREKRVGRHGRRFTIYKFRSMYTPEHLRKVRDYRESEALQMRRRQDEKHRHDPRITPIGRHLRKLSLDELPQLVNVLRGDMSLIGPRPVVEAELDRYGANAFFYKLAVPGVTGLWQVSGRNDVTYDQRVRLDVEYCATWSLGLDLSILLRTIPVVLLRKGAY